MVLKISSKEETYLNDLIVVKVRSKNTPTLLEYVGFKLMNMCILSLAS